MNQPPVKDGPPMNQDIRAPRVLLIDQHGEKQGVMPTSAALEAADLAGQRGDGDDAPVLDRAAGAARQHLAHAQEGAAGIHAHHAFPFVQRYVQHRQPAGVIDVRMREHHGAQLRDVERQVRILGVRVAATPLEHPEVEGDGRSGYLHEVAGPGYFAGSAEERYFHDE